MDGQILHILAAALFDDFQRGAAEEVLHDVHQLVIIQFADGAQAFGQNFTVATMGAERVVVDVQAVGLSDGRRFLSHGQVGRTGVVVFHAHVFAVQLQFVDDRLERAQRHHVVVDVHKVFFLEEFLLFRGGLGVGVHGDRREVDFTFLEQFFRIDFQTLRHGCFLLLFKSLR